MKQPIEGTQIPPGIAAQGPLPPHPHAPEALVREGCSGEWLRGVRAINSVIERKFLVIELDDVRNGVLPEGASDQLVRALQTIIKTGVLPKIAAPKPRCSQSTQTTFEADQLIVGSEQHLGRFERIVGDAKSDVFVLSTFVASQADERGREQRERIWRAPRGGCHSGRALSPVLRDNVG